MNYCIDQLKDRGFLEYIGEYGAEITTFVPFVAWLHGEGFLNGRRIITYVGMRPYYFFLDDDQIEERSEPRNWLPIAQRCWPGNSTYHAVRSAWHVYPDFRRHYAAAGRSFDRPVIFLQNKFVIEWAIGPINFMPLNALQLFLEWTKDTHRIIYSRPETRANQAYTSDHNMGLSYPDLQIVSQYPHAIHFEEYCREAGREYNLLKLETLAQSHLFAAAQGGGAHILACFGNSLLLVLDRSEDCSPEGSEYPHAYRSGPYKYLSAEPPTLMVARRFSDFVKGLQLLAHAMPHHGRIDLPARFMPALDELRM
ncbi:MAG: hypothetical protein EOP61_23510 [Sphingomonadales bacterium]|nr:MAG: hypothetical protein EOP61_23510 [Sphingomonadales bacterium]